MPRHHRTTHPSFNDIIANENGEGILIKRPYASRDRTKRWKCYICTPEDEVLSGHWYTWRKLDVIHHVSSALHQGHVILAKLGGSLP